MKILVTIPDKYLDIAKTLSGFYIDSNEVKEKLFELLEQAKQSEQPLSIGMETISDTRNVNADGIYTSLAILSMIQLGKDNNV